MKTAKTINKFNQSHDSLRRFLRLISYGCYHRKLFRLHGIKERTYDDELRQLRFFIPDGHILESRQQGHTHVTFRVNPYISPENYLVNSFLLKSLLPDACLHSIMILQLTAGTDTPLSLTEITGQIETALLEHDPDFANSDTDLGQLIRRRMSELVELGLVATTGKGKNIRYLAPPRPLLELTAPEATSLLEALSFYRNVSLLSAPGYFLQQNLKELYPDTNARDGLFQFRNNTFTRILDDEILLSLVRGIKENRPLRLEREGKAPLIVTPLAIYTDYRYNRQYLLALKAVSPRQSEPVNLRIDLLTKATPASGSPLPHKVSRQKVQEIHLKVSCPSPAEYSQRKKLLLSNGAQITSESPHAFSCSLPSKDPLRLYPWLWTLQPWAEILPGKDGLRNRMIKDLQDAQAAYRETDSD